LLAKVEMEGAMIMWPQVLPDEKSVIFTRLQLPPTTIMLQSLKSGEIQELFEGDAARYLPTGHLVYWLQNSIFAVPFNPDTLEVAGGAIPIVEGVFRMAAPQYAVSALPLNLHPEIIEMLERCLEKDTKNQYHDIADSRVDIQKVLAVYM